MTYDQAFWLAWHVQFDEVEPIRAGDFPYANRVFTNRLSFQLPFFPSLEMVPHHLNTAHCCNLPETECLCVFPVWDGHVEALIHVLEPGGAYQMAGVGEDCFHCLNYDDPDCKPLVARAVELRMKSIEGLREAFEAQPIQICNDFISWSEYNRREDDAPTHNED